MSARHRLEKLEQQFASKNGLDVKFSLKGSNELPLETIGHSVADSIEAHLAGRGRPMPPFGDDPRTRKQ